MQTGVLSLSDLIQNPNEFDKPTRKLLPELVPSSAWMSNLRTELSTSTWNDLRAYYGNLCNWRCEVTGTVGKKHPVELHEHWFFDMQKGKQVLTGLSMLAPNVHLVMHPGFAGEQGKYELMLDAMV
ncbi:MAG: hypothetical protein EOM68_20250, partial [Spirochaetia bacterium]|nr:hypothetical protein [Spirochaetia bacterium]